MSTPPTSDTTPPTSAEPKKKSLYHRYQDAKSGRNTQISDADMKKYTGMTRDELGEWSKDRPGVGGNKAAGDITAGPASGLGGSAAGEGYGGWGMGARGDLKFPVVAKKEGKGVDGEDEEE